MYERPDVPKGGKYTNVIAVTVLVVIAIAVFVLVATLWRLANENTALGDKDLATAVSAATPTTETQVQLGSDIGYVPSGDTLTTVLFVVTPDNSTGKLSSLYLAVLNETQGTSTLVQIPADARLRSDSATSSLAAIYASNGSATLASTLASECGVPVSHLAVMDESGWNAFMTVASQGTSALASKATELAGGITKSDMDTVTLLDLAKRAVSAGLSSDSMAEVNTTDETDPNGASYKEMLPSDIAILAGALRQR